MLLIEQLDVTQWTPVTKDGAALPTAQTAPRPARQQIGVGETSQASRSGARPQNLWLDVRRGSGEWVLQAPIEIR